MKKLIVNADDFGRSSAINHGILEAHQRGIVTSASLMTTGEAFAEAVDLAQANPRLGIGLHLDLDSFFEVQHGAGRLMRYQNPNVSLPAIAEAAETQIRKVMETGLAVSHLDGHHHVHLRPELFATLAALTAKYKVGFIRYFRGFYEGFYADMKMDWIVDLMQRFNLRFVDTFFAGWERVESSLPGYSYFDPAASFSIGELMVHPGRGEAWREKDLALCVSEQTRARLRQEDITLVSFTQA